jgi:hypothetical protein
MKFRPSFIVPILSSLFPSAYLHAQQPPDPVCVLAEKVPIPKADQPPSGYVPPSNCDPLELQGATGHPINLRTARYCAYAASTAPSTDKTDAEMENITGYAGLAMIYAGGKGVAPDLPLAIHFACKIQGDWDDGTEVAKMLDEKRRKGADHVDFDICGSPTGRQLNFMCLGRDQARADAENALAEKRFNTGTPQQRAAFRRLVTARNAFDEAHAVEEPSGTTGTVQQAMRDEIDFDHAWGRRLDNLAAGKLPTYTEEEFNKADAELNRVYQEAQRKAARCSDDYCVSSDKLRQLERAWINYRDAWVAYGTLRWPAVPGDTWRTWLTLEQIEDLKGAAE